jgi:hypothetical protein
MILALVSSKAFIRVISDGLDDEEEEEGGKARTKDKRKRMQGKKNNHPKSLRGEDGFLHTSTCDFFEQM